MKLIDSENTVIYEAYTQEALYVHKLLTGSASEVTEDDEIKYEKQLRSEWKGNLKIQLDLKLKGVDNWNRACFYSEDFKLYIGSTSILFDYNESIEKIKDTFRKDSSTLCIFGDEFGCEPSGSTINFKFKINIL